VTNALALRRPEYEEIWESVVDWLDEMFRTDHRDHRLVNELEMNIESMSYEIHQMDMGITTSDLTPTVLVASHRLGLRFRDMYKMLDRKWAAEPVKRSSERALRGIHEHFLGTIPSAKERHAVFETARIMHDTHLYSYLQAHRIDREDRWGRSPTGRSVPIVAVEGALWVHDLYRHLADPTLKGRRLRAHYHAPVGKTWADEGHYVGRPIHEPTRDVIDTALRLWTPDDHGTTYERLESAVDAAIRL
jgi:adenosyl cobinamide kinase/adenosyl cobinamide phosphate guanylyltransferase